MAAHAQDAHQNHMNSSNGEQSTSSGSYSDSSGSSKASPPSTPPSPEENNETQTRSVPVDNGSYNSNSSRTPRRHRQIASSHRLGAIDEDSSVVSPDIPVRNPLRNFRSYPAARLFGFKAPTTNGHLNGSAKPPDLYDGMVGPNGEKFSDLRENKRSSKPGKPKNRRRMLFIGVAILAVIIGLAVGLGVGLTRKKSHKDESNNAPPSSANSTQGFPAGTWGITTYLTNVNTSCTPNDSTWQCYPYRTYNESASGSLSTLDWVITSAAGGSYLITATSPVFSYPFSNITLQPGSGSGEDSAFTFNYKYRKTVVPSAPITTDGAASRCYYDNVLLSVRLYTQRQKDSVLTSAETGNGGTGNSQDWPYAVEYSEMISEEPKCFRYVNGQDGDPITITGTSIGGACECGYRNYGVGS